ncbi:hypothetical protein WN51_12812 [Melipona quadrifasciata]|uniref:Uncharacterized protein n=1 Tax=Melipona quadrifasciata TaxID=166423 RepID=A0A0M9A489_9HYME|nr:hypothetical protein WN51_12812 [Melipona quadrifasciata]
MIISRSKEGVVAGVTVEEKEERKRKEGRNRAGLWPWLLSEGDSGREWLLKETERERTIRKKGRANVNGDVNGVASPVKGKREENRDKSNYSVRLYNTNIVRVRIELELESTKSELCLSHGQVCVRPLPGLGIMPSLCIGDQDLYHKQRSELELDPRINPDWNYIFRWIRFIFQTWVSLESVPNMDPCLAQINIKFNYNELKFAWNIINGADLCLQISALDQVKSGSCLLNDNLEEEEEEEEELREGKDNGDRSEINEDKDGRTHNVVSFYLRAPIDDTAAGNNAKSPDTLHPPKLIVPRSEFPSFLPPSSLPIELGTYKGQLFIETNLILKQHHVILTGTFPVYFGILKFTKNVSKISRTDSSKSGNQCLQQFLGQSKIALIIIIIIITTTKVNLRVKFWPVLGLYQDLFAGCKFHRRLITLILVENLTSPLFRAEESCELRAEVDRLAVPTGAN